MEYTLVKQEAGERIANDICEAIRSGILKPGDKLQGEAELARIYNGSIYNVRKALSRLKKDQVVHSVPKVGVFISEQPAAVPSDPDRGARRIPRDSFRKFRKIPFIS